METLTVTVKQLFGAERRFLVPIFQRGYVWTRAGQWEPLWRDVVDQALVVRRELVRPSRHARRHFLGAVVLGEDQNRIRHVSSSAVIDGQQRLTTLQVLLAALRDAVAPLGERNLDRQLLRLTDNEGEWADRDERFKIWPTNAYQDDFRRVLTAGSAEALAAAYPQRVVRRRPTPPRPALVDAYLYFAAAVDAYLRGSDECNVAAPADAPPRPERALELVEAVQSYLQLVTIELGAEDDPQVIFETLNARGVDLEPSDLVRNFVFLYAARHDEDPVALYARYWRAFDEAPAYAGAPPGAAPWWRVKERQGRLLRERLDLFCFHYVTYRVNREIKIGHLFQEFRDWWETGDAVVDEAEDGHADGAGGAGNGSARHTGGGGDVTSGRPRAQGPAQPPVRVASVELARVARAAADFRALVAPDRGTRMGVFADRVKRLDTTTVYPLVLWLAEHRDGVAPAEFDAMLTDVESYLVRRAVCGLTNKNYNQVFLALLRKLRRRGAPSHAALREALAGSGGDSSLWPDDDQFTQALLFRPVYTQLGPAKTQMLLEALDAASEDPRAERVIRSALTVEHVLPQAADPTVWPFPVEAGSGPAEDDTSGNGAGVGATAPAGGPAGGASGSDPSARRSDPGEWAAIRATLLHTLGNLTLVTQPLNSSLGRDGFARKRRELAEVSRLALNAYFQRADAGAAWDERAIVARSRALAALACRVWPHPGVAPGAPAGAASSAADRRAAGTLATLGA